MKIALLGAKKSGKTAYFTGLYAQYRNLIAYQPATPKRRHGSAARPVRESLGFKIGIDDGDAELVLASRADGFFETPMIFSDPTGDLDEVEISTQFAFLVDATKEPGSPYERCFGIADPPGGSFRGEGARAQADLALLASCDAYLLFLDGEHVQAASKSRNGPAMLGHRASLGKIRDLIEAARNHANQDDIIPICVVISKFDVFGNRLSNAVRSLVYDQIVLPLSRYSKNYMICICPVSVRNPATHEFAGYNLEWPFVFCTAATIFRNAFASRTTAAEKTRQAAQLDNRAAEVETRGWYGRLKAFLSGSGVQVSRREAATYRAASGRLVEAAADDTQLARLLWSQIALQGADVGVRVYMDGRDVDASGLADLYVA